MQLLMDMPDDYEPSRQTRAVVKRNISINNIAMNYKKPKNPKAKFIKCKLYFFYSNLNCSISYRRK